MSIVTRLELVSSRCLEALLGTKACWRGGSTQEVEVVQLLLPVLLWSQCNRNWSQGPAIAVWLVAMTMTTVARLCQG